MCVAVDAGERKLSAVGGGARCEKQVESRLLLGFGGAEVIDNAVQDDWVELQGSANRLWPGLVKFVPAVAYHFCLNLPPAFTQPGLSLLAEPFT